MIIFPHEWENIIMILWGYKLYLCFVWFLFRVWYYIFANDTFNVQHHNVWNSIRSTHPPQILKQSLSNNSNSNSSEKMWWWTNWRTSYFIIYNCNIVIFVLWVRLYVPFSDINVNGSNIFLFIVCLWVHLVHFFFFFYVEGWRPFSLLYVCEWIRLSKNCVCDDVWFPSARPHTCITFDNVYTSIFIIQQNTILIHW